AAVAGSAARRARPDAVDNHHPEPGERQPIIVPSQDIVLGLYHITMERPDIAGLALPLGGFARGDQHDVIGGMQKAIKAGTAFLYAPGEKPSRLARELANADSPVVDRLLNGQLALHPRMN